MSEEEFTKRVLTAMPIKEKDIAIGANEVTEEISVNIVASVAAIKILVESTGQTDTVWAGKAIDTKNTGIKQIYICPNAHLPAVNLSGYEARQIMKTKNRKDPCVYVNGGSSAGTLSEIYNFDFRDYMNKFPLGLPEEAQSIQIKIVFNPFGSWGTNFDSGTNIKLTVQVIQDEGLDQTIGYRRYLTKSLPIVISDVNLIKKEPLARNGFVDSLVVDSNAGTNKVNVGDITIIRNEVDFPLKSTWNLERACALLHQDWDSNICYCDLVRPIYADPGFCKSLDLEMQIKPFTNQAGTETGQITLIYEYVHFWMV